MKSATAAVLLVILSGCSANRLPDIPLEPYSLSEVQREAVKKAVSNRFKDPNSAQFESFVAMNQGGKVHVCGRVNAKNSFGGYGGFVPFWVDVGADTNYAVLMNSAVDGNEFAYSVVRGQCSSLGLIVL